MTFLRLLSCTIFAASAALLLPAMAQANELATPSIRQSAFPDLTTAPKLDNLTTRLHCEIAKGEDPALYNPTCNGTLIIYGGADSYWWAKKWTQIARVNVAVPTQGSLDVVTSVKLDKLLDSMDEIYLKAKWLDAGEAMSSAMELSDERALTGNEEHRPLNRISRPVASRLNCGIPTNYSYKSKKKLTREVTIIHNLKSYTLRTTENAKKLNKKYWYRANATTTVSLNGLKYVMTKGSRFAFQCTSVDVISKGKQWPAMSLSRGQVSVAGRPKGKAQLTSGVLTAPGLFSSDSPKARVSFVVKANDSQGKFKNPLKQIWATMNSKQGTLTARQRLKMTPSAHCTPGRGVKMLLNGKTTQLKR